MISRARILALASPVLVVSWMWALACSQGATPCGPFGCIDASNVDPFGDAALPLRAAALFEQSCSGGPERGCHSELAANMSTTILPSDPSYATYGMVDVPSSELPDVLRVAPFHPESSYVLWKVSGDPRILDGSFIMPATSAVMTGTVDPRIVALVSEWIEAGAPQ